MAALAKQEFGKPDYLGLLNAISLAETEAGIYLNAWANATDDAELAETLRFVAARETSHGEVFCRRIAELGFELRQKPNPKAGERLLKVANPKIPDCEKIPAQSEIDEDPFGEIDKAIAAGRYDPMTENLLRWYIAEERDSGRRLRKCYDAVRAKMAPQGKAKASAAMAANANGPSPDTQALMACMSEGFARLEKTIEKLARAIK